MSVYVWCFCYVRVHIYIFSISLYIRASIHPPSRSIRPYSWFSPYFYSWWCPPIWSHSSFFIFAFLSDGSCHPAASPWWWVMPSAHGPSLLIPPDPPDPEKVWSFTSLEASPFWISTFKWSLLSAGEVTNWPDLSPHLCWHDLWSLCVNA